MIFDYFIHAIDMNFSNKLSNELMINRNSYNNNINDLFENSEVIKRAYVKVEKKESKTKKTTEISHHIFSNKKSSSKESSFDSSSETMVSSLFIASS